MPLTKPTGRLLVTLFFLAWGILSVFWSASVITNGEFYDKGKHADIGAETRPGYFWTVVSITILMGVFGIWRGIVELRAYLRRRNTEGVSSEGVDMMQDLQKHMIKKGQQGDDAT